MQDKRKPVGRPRLHPEQDDNLSNYNVRMTAYQARMARRLGFGNMSEGLRHALDIVIRNSELCIKSDKEKS